DVDWSDFREKQQAAAESDLRGTFILDRIAEVENIEETDEEVDKEIEKLAARQQSSLTAMKARLTKEGGLDSIKRQVRNRKALDFVIASADIRTEKADPPGMA
ncbi:MAG: hypothetical protein L0229_22795, partial [Blastocatellia bacterium]|nr:hypothetical protein [Blastocatellia bacterium]